MPTYERFVAPMPRNFEKKKQKRVHRFNIIERMSSEENLQKQSVQSTREERKVDERSVFRF